MKKYISFSLIVSSIVMLISSPSYSYSPPEIIFNQTGQTIHVFTKKGHAQLSSWDCVWIPHSQFPAKIVGLNGVETQCKKPHTYNIYRDNKALQCTPYDGSFMGSCKNLSH